MIQKKGRLRFRMVVPKYPNFNVYSSAARITTALGPLSVATVVSRLPDWDVEVIDENNYRYPGPLTENGSPDHQVLQELHPADVVGFYGGLSCTQPRLLELARIYKSWGIFTIGGGHHLDAIPEEAFANGIDVVVHGEGEITICDLLKTWRNGGCFDDIKGISFLRNEEVFKTEPQQLIEEFDMLPLPDFGLLRFAKMNIYPVNRIRGCGKNCEFCAVKGRARCCSPERLLDQFSYLAETFGARRFLIVDDQFAQHRQETKRFCKLLADYQTRMNLRFFIFVQIRVEAARDIELLDLMRACGIRVLAIGYESVIDEELHSMGKGQKLKDMIELTHAYRQHGFLIHGMFIMWYPMQKGEERPLTISERIKRFKQFIKKSRLDTVQVVQPIPLPGTALRERLEREGRILPLSEIGWEYYDGNFPLIMPDPPLTPEEVQRASIGIMGGFYRFGSMFMVGLRILLFPLSMLPFTNLKSRFLHWYRAWRRHLLGFIGWSIIRRWKKLFKDNPFQQKLLRAKAMKGLSHPMPKSQLS